MITLEQLAAFFENGLNGLYNNPYIKFHIWASAGHVDEPIRDGNTVTHFITGNLLTSSSSNDANLLVMGANGLTLEFSIPVKRPRTTATQTSEELQEVVNGQYPFVNEIAEVINSYFQEAQAFTLMDGDDEYSLSFQAGTSLTGTVDLQPGIGKHVTASVSITVYFVKGGIISRDVSLTLDGVPVPYQVLRVGRSTESARDVYAGKEVSKTVSSSSAFSIDLQYPLNADHTTEETLSFLMDGLPNTAHFVALQYGKDASKRLYLMTIDNTIANAQGVTVSGANIALCEVVENVQTLNFPSFFQVGRFRFSVSTAETVEFVLAENCDYYLGGIAAEGNGSITAELTPDDFVYEEETDAYYVYLVTDKKVEVTSTVPFEVL